jgi:hypothetical protein
MTPHPNQPVFEYQKEELEAAQREYRQALNRAWTQRKKGVPHEGENEPKSL